FVSAAPRNLHSFPTRRSSDLLLIRACWILLPGRRTRRTRLAEWRACPRLKNPGLEIRLRSRSSVSLITFRAALHVPDVALACVLRRHRHPGRSALRERILGDAAQVALGD